MLLNNYSATPGINILPPLLFPQLGIATTPSNNRQKKDAKASCYACAYAMQVKKKVFLGET